MNGRTKRGWMERDGLQCGLGRSLTLLVTLGVLAGVGGATGWAPTWEGPLGRSGHGMAFHPDLGQMVVFGGQTPLVRSNDTWFFDGAVWTPGPSAPAGMEGRYGHGMVLDPVRRVIVMFGGQAPLALMNDTWEFDGTGWTQGPPAPPGLTPRTHMGMVWDAGRGRVVMFGGRDGNASAVDEVWEYDGTTWTLSPAAPGPIARFEHGMAYDPVRQVSVVFGGYWVDAQGFFWRLNDTWEYDGSDWQQGPAAPAGLEPRVGSTLGFDEGRGVVVLVGGLGTGVAPVIRSDTWFYDGIAWIQGPAAPPGFDGRSMATLAWDPGASRLRLFGGFAYNHYTADHEDAWELGPSGWIQTPARPSARDQHAMTYDSLRGVGILFGGRGSNGESLNDIWEFDGTTWSRGPDPPAGMAARTDPVAAFDSARGRTVIFGGWEWNGNRLLDDTWEYDGVGWYPGAPAASGMNGRTSTAMAFDQRRGRMVLFGGYQFVPGRPCPTCNDTWEYDGTAWTAGATAPAALLPRMGHSMTWDPNRQVVVLVGGSSLVSTSIPLDDMWEYDGNSWQQVGVGSLPRLLHTISYDTARDRLVLIGGDPGNGSASGEVWEFDGGSWKAGSSMPPGMELRVRHNCYYDEGRARIVFYGGADVRSANLHPYGDQWEYGQVRDQVLGGLGYGPGNANRVRVLDESGRSTPVDFNAYGAGSWGVLARGAEVAGQGLGEIITTPGPGPTLGPQVRAFTAQGSALAKVNFFAYGTLKYGAVASGVPVDADLFDELVTAAGSGAVFGPHIRGFDVDSGVATPRAGINFFSYSTLKYGARVGGGDLELDGYGEVLTGAGPGAVFGAHARGWDVDGSVAAPLAGVSFFAHVGTTHGVEVESGDVDDDGRDEIVTAVGPDPTSAPAYAGFWFDGGTVASLPGFVLSGAGTAYGGRVGMGELGSTPRSELLVAPGPDPTAPAVLDAYAYDGTVLSPFLSGIMLIPTGAYGANVDGGLVR